MKKRFDFDLNTNNPEHINEDITNQLGKTSSTTLKDKSEEIDLDTDIFCSIIENRIKSENFANFSEHKILTSVYPSKDFQINPSGYYVTLFKDHRTFDIFIKDIYLDGHFFIGFQTSGQMIYLTINNDYKIITHPFFIAFTEENADTILPKMSKKIYKGKFQTDEVKNTKKEFEYRPTMKTVDLYLNLCSFIFDIFFSDRFAQQNIETIDYPSQIMWEFTHKDLNESVGGQISNSSKSSLSKSSDEYMLKDVIIKNLIEKIKKKHNLTANDGTWIGWDCFFMESIPKRMLKKNNIKWAFEVSDFFYNYYPKKHIPFIKIEDYTRPVPAWTLYLTLETNEIEVGGGDWFDETDDENVPKNYFGIEDTTDTCSLETIYQNNKSDFFKIANLALPELNLKKLVPEHLNETIDSQTSQTSSDNLQDISLSKSVDAFEFIYSRLKEKIKKEGEKCVTGTYLYNCLLPKCIGTEKDEENDANYNIYINSEGIYDSALDMMAIDLCLDNDDKIFIFLVYYYIEDWASYTVSQINEDESDGEEIELKEFAQDNPEDFEQLVKRVIPECEHLLSNLELNESIKNQTDSTSSQEITSRAEKINTEELLKNETLFPFNDRLAFILYALSYRHYSPECKFTTSIIDTAAKLDNIPFPTNIETLCGLHFEKNNPFNIGMKWIYHNGGYIDATPTSVEFNTETKEYRPKKCSNENLKKYADFKNWNIDFQRYIYFYFERKFEIIDEGFWGFLNPIDDSKFRGPKQGRRKKLMQYAAKKFKNKPILRYFQLKYPEDF